MLPSKHIRTYSSSLIGHEFGLLIFTPFKCVHNLHKMFRIITVRNKIFKNNILTMLVHELFSCELRAVMLHFLSPGRKTKSIFVAKGRRYDFENIALQDHVVFLQIFIVAKIA